VGPTSRRTPALLPKVLPTLLVAALAGGCGAMAQRAGSAPGDTTRAGSTATTTTSSTRGTASGLPTHGGRMTTGLSSPVVMERSGGIAGRLDRVEVRPDGSYAVSSRTSRPVTRQLSEAELAAVVAAVRTADLPRQPAADPPTAAQADVFRYRLVAEGRTLVTTEQQADDAVRRLIGVLSNLFSAPAPRP
jgi:hypothetical protein